MQQFVSIPSTDTLTNSRQELLNNDCTIMSNSSGTSFPTTNLQQGMFCFRTDLNQLYQLKDLTPTWIMVFDLSQLATNKAYVDNQISTLAASTVATSQVVTTAMANKILQLNSSGQLPASITGNAASATNVAWSGVTGTPSTYTPPIATASVLGGVKQGANVTIAADGTISVAASNPLGGKQLFTSSGTFTVPTGVTQVWVSMCGGGGGGNGANGGNITTSFGGGAAKAVLAQAVTGLTGGQTITVTVGAAGAAGSAGGTSSFGAYISCPGGGAGTGSSVGASGGSGGGAGSNVRGWGNGSEGWYIGVTGSGGSGLFGEGGGILYAYGTTGAPSVTGPSATGYGAGGAGGYNAGAGTGSPGVVLVEW